MFCKNYLCFTIMLNKVLFSISNTSQNGNSTLRFVCLLMTVPAIVDSTEDTSKLQKDIDQLG